MVESDLDFCFSTKFLSLFIYCLIRHVSLLPLSFMLHLVSFEISRIILLAIRHFTRTIYVSVSDIHLSIKITFRTFIVSTLKVL